MNSNKGLMVIVMLYIASMSVDLLACMTTLINDSAGKIAVFNKIEKTFMFIPKNGKRRFGSHHKHAHFALYMENPKTHLWSRKYVCKQKECGTSGNVQLKFSDVQNGTDATALFAITKSKPHSSMVRELPMIQKKSCHSCHGR